MWKHAEEIIGIILGSALIATMATIPRDFLLHLLPTSTPPKVLKALGSPYPLLVAFGLMAGWMSHAEVVGKDVRHMDYVRLCMRTSPTTGHPVDICDTLDERLMGAIARPAAECRKAFPKLDPRVEMACKDPDAEGWRH